MKVLFDHNVDRRLRRHLSGHEYRTTREMGWETLENGSLLKTSAANGFEAFVRIDKNIEHQQNLRSLPLPVIVLDAPSNALTRLLPFCKPLMALLSTPLDRALYIIQLDGSILRLIAPR